MVVGLFEGIKPPFLARTLVEVPACIKSYEQIANQLRQSVDVDGYYRFNQAASLLKKLEDVPFEGFEPDKTAYTGWLASEEECRKTNAALWDMYQHPLSYVETPLTRLIVELREEIKDLLGDIPPKFNDVMRFGNFGPGTSLTTPMEDTDPLLKAINPSCLTSLKAECFQLYAQSQMGDVVASARTDIKNTTVLGRSVVGRIALDGTEFYDHAKLSIVPKNLWTGRPIEVGGSITTWIQQCFDGYIRRRLEDCWNLDLSDQTLNQHMAFLGSLSEPFRQFCTIDLTSASDRIALLLVYLLLPPKWFALLYRCTNRTTYVPEEISGVSGGLMVKLEKFSAMGNSLTFSLQTTIFGALVRSVLRDRGANTRWRVYGDDIIVDKSIYDEVIDGLKALGFEPNPAKSYSQGYFRESCGADYFLGEDVRALYIKQPIRTVVDVYKYLNLIQLHIRHHPDRVALWVPLYQYLLGLVPPAYKVVGIPTRCLDGYIWAPELVPVAPSQRMPRFILVKGFPGDPVPQPFDYWRTLLVKRSGDSSIRCNVGDELPPEAEARLIGKEHVLKTIAKWKRKNARVSILDGKNVIWTKARPVMGLTPLVWGKEEGGISPLAL